MLLPDKEKLCFKPRVQRAERKAARAPSLMILPMALFIMPSVFIIILPLRTVVDGGKEHDQQKEE